ncbi:SDR family oxidoreductase [Rhodovulum sulfidophilum]|uniref:SDR family oxidoreductase n=1 Tax=Rhodovulum sulfidophilum TaxID=35806 RepID=UPI001F218C6A|nr:SDR family oxidoreductase [Rhodovulum sulfidophilum]MCE8439055.1 SDR family oxidoreductase [Rhodovulum sulfidophilum]MCE8467879.1 SDR family oxidoreductase [Rhodovulum sulfidophilum]
MTVAITGATGQLGRLVIDTLKDKIAPDGNVALARSTDKAADLGVPARVFDYDAPETLAPALDGIDTLLLISGSDIGRRVPQHAAVIKAAKSAGVQHIVYTSLLNAPTSTLGLAPEHVETEELLAASGIEHTILRNGWYTENYTMGLPSALEHNALFGAAKDGRISSATRQDYAEAAAAVLMDAGPRGKTYELSGDDNFALSDLAATLSAQAGKDIPYVDMPEADYAAALAGPGLPAELAGFLAHCDVEASKGVPFEEGTQLSTLIGRPTTPLATAVATAIL